MAKARRRMKGRHIVQMVYEYHKLDETQNELFTIDNILAIQLAGDKLQKFLSDWNNIAAGQGAPADKTLLKPLLLRQVRNSPRLKDDIAHYGRAVPGTCDISYA
jgi:hypothetical protein